MIKNWDDFKLNECINPVALRMTGFYRVDESEMESIINEFVDNGIIFKYDNSRNYTVIETFEYELPYNIILKNGGVKLSYSLENDNYEHDCVLLRSKPVNIPKGAYM